MENHKGSGFRGQEKMFFSSDPFPNSYFDPDSSIWYIIDKPAYNPQKGEMVSSLLNQLSL